MATTAEQTNSFALVTGDTYQNRRTLRAMGGVFDYAEKGYWLPECKAEDARKVAGLSVEIVHTDKDPFRTLTSDELRDQRQARIDRKRDRLIDRAERAERRSSEAYNKLSPHERDFLRLGEPVKVGHHSERRHTKLIDKAWNSFMESGKEANYAHTLRRRADWMMDARVAGDKERERDAIREKVRAMIAVGDTIHEPVYGNCVVLKMFAKSAQVRDSKGDVLGVSLHWLRLVSKGDPAARPPEREWTYKPGDKALWRGPIGGWDTPREVTVKRRTSFGYSIVCDFLGTKPWRARESSLIPLA